MNPNVYAKFNNNEGGIYNIYDVRLIANKMLLTHTNDVITSANKYLFDILLVYYKLSQEEKNNYWNKVTERELEKLIISIEDDDQIYGCNRYIKETFWNRAICISFKYSYTITKRLIDISETRNLKLIPIVFNTITYDRYSLLPRRRSRYIDRDAKVIELMYSFVFPNILINEIVKSITNDELTIYVYILTNFVSIFGYSGYIEEYIKQINIDIHNRLTELKQKLR